MHFVFPWFLLALAALAVPVIIHLFHFRRYKKIYFSDIRFLKQVNEEKTTIDELKNRLILASRLFALFFLVLAFAQPFLGDKKSQLNKGASAVAVYIDNSYSMGLKKAGESGLDMAKSKAKEIANAFNTGDKFALLTNDLEGSHQRWMQKQDFIDAVDKVELTSAVKTTNEIAQKESALFQSAGMKNKLGFFISDFQKNMLANLSDTNYTAYFLPLTSDEEKNIFVDSCWMEQPLFTLNAVNKMLVRLVNSGNSNVEKLRISIKINGQVKAINDVDIPAGNTRVDSFSFTITQPGIQRGEIELNDYPITFDDHFYFAFTIQENEKVLSIEDAASGNYIASIFSGDKHFAFDKVNKGQVDYSTLKNYSLIILNQLSDISSGLNSTLKDFVNNGGNIYVIPAGNANLASYNAFLTAVNAGILGAFQTKNGEVDKINLKEDIFKSVFSALPKNVETPKIKQFYPILSRSSLQERQLLSTNLGSPLVTRFDAGNGFVYVQAVPLNPDFSNLQATAIFAPMVYNFAVYKKNTTPLYYTIGKDNLIELKNEQTSGEQIYKLTNGKNEFIPENRSIGNTLLLHVNQILPSDGHYTISNNEKMLGVAAFNFDRSESVLKFATPSDLKQKYTLTNQLVLNNSAVNLSAKVKQIKDGVLFWKVCVILALLFLLAEILLIRFWKQASSAAN